MVYSSEDHQIFCCGLRSQTLARAFQVSQPEIFNTDQGVQFTSLKFTGHLENRGIRVSMDGRGRVFDNIFVERLWRTVKYEEVYLHDYQTVSEVRKGLVRYFLFYNQERLHESLGIEPLLVSMQGPSPFKQLAGFSNDAP